MDKFYDVEGIEFEDQYMILRVDGQTYRLRLSQISPRLAAATAAQRQHYEISASGYGIHWPDVDEDLSIPGLLRSAGVARKAA